MAAWNSFTYKCIRALHSLRSFAHCRAAYTVIPLLPTAAFTPSIQPTLGLLRSRPFRMAIDNLLAIRYSSILSTCPNHLNTLRSALPANSFYIPVLLPTSSFLTLSFVTVKSNFSNISSQEHWLSFYQHFSYMPHPSAPYNAVGTITPSYRHFLAFVPNLLLLRTLFSAPHALYPSFILCTRSISHPFHRILTVLKSPFMDSATPDSEIRYSLIRRCHNSYTLSGRKGKVVASHAEGCKVARSNPGCGPSCTDLHYARGAHGVVPMRVGGATSQLDLPSLTPLSVAVVVDCS